MASFSRAHVSLEKLFLNSPREIDKKPRLLETSYLERAEFSPFPEFKLGSTGRKRNKTAYVVLILD